MSKLNLHKQKVKCDCGYRYRLTDKTCPECLTVIDHKLDHNDDNIDIIFDTIDKMCWDEKWDEIDQIIANVDIENTTLTVLIGYLSITFCIKDKLKNRKEYMEKCMKIDDREGLWSGLG